MKGFRVVQALFGLLFGVALCIFAVLTKIKDSDYLVMSLMVTMIVVPLVLIISAFCAKKTGVIMIRGMRFAFGFIGIIVGLIGLAVPSLPIYAGVFYFIPIFVMVLIESTRKHGGINVVLTILMDIILLVWAVASFIVIIQIRGKLGNICEEIWYYAPGAIGAIIVIKCLLDLLIKPKQKEAQ